MNAPQPLPELRDLIRAARNNKGLTQAELAEAVGMSQRWMSDVESGDTKTPRPAVVRRLADVLDLDIADLYAAIFRARSRNEGKRIAEVVPEYDQDPLDEVLMSGARTLTPSGKRTVIEFIKLQRQAEEEARRNAASDRGNG